MEGFSNDSSQPCVCIGSKLRLLSQLKVRYEGTLYSVDTQKSTISLKNVRTFGTEGRSMDGNEVPGSEEVFEIIVFRAADISEIFMIEAPTAVSVDPAIVDYQQTREKQNAANAMSSQREFQAGHNVTSVDSRVSTPGPESVQSGDVHHVPRHDGGAKSMNKPWGNDRSGDREHQSGWGNSQRSGQLDRRPPPTDNRRDRDGYGERNGPYSAGDRKNVTNGNGRTYQNQQHGRSAGYGFNESGPRQNSARQGGYYDQEQRQGYRQGGENGARSGWRDQRDNNQRQDYQRGGQRDVQGRGGYYNQRDGGDDRHQAVPQRRQQYSRDGPQQSQRGRGQPMRKDLHGGQRSRDRDNNRDRDPQSKDSKNVQQADYDFEKANEEFSKLDLGQAPVEKDNEAANGSETENKDGAESPEPTYQKDSFFDEISRDSTRQNQRPKTSERSLNMQTFGAAATRRRPATGRYYNRRPGNWTGSGAANGGESSNGTAQVSA